MTILTINNTFCSRAGFNINLFLLNRGATVIQRVRSGTSDWIIKVEENLDMTTIDSIMADVDSNLLI